MELLLDRHISDRRVFPAIDLNRSSTRREELLLNGRGTQSGLLGAQLPVRHASLRGHRVPSWAHAAGNHEPGVPGLDGCRRIADPPGRHRSTRWVLGRSPDRGPLTIDVQARTPRASPVRGGRRAVAMTLPRRTNNEDPPSGHRGRPDRRRFRGRGSIRLRADRRPPRPPIRSRGHRPGHRCSRPDTPGGRPDPHRGAGRGGRAHE